MYATGRPDGAIRNAQDLLKINKHEDALGSLMEFMGTKRFQQWSPSHEKAMLMLIGLSIQLRKNAKFALVQYRLIAQQHTASFERVIREYLRLALEQVDAVEREVVDAEQKLKEDILEQENKLLEDDEDVGFAPQEQLFFVSGVGGEDFDQRVRRRLLGPWLRYLWDMFRSILDVLKNNSKLDHLYHEVSLKALDYCLRFQRPTEFRRLCELLRSHLLNMEKYQGQQSYGIDLRISESVVSYISTRCSQLKAACDLEIWTEAMTIVSDIHHLMELKADTILLPHSLMKKFYQSLVRIFWASEHFLFHAYAQRQLFLACHAELESLIETRSSEVEINAVSSEMRNAASHVVLSFLLIPSDSDLGKKVLLPEQIEIAEILDSVLDLAGYPSRQDLLQRILSGFGPDEVLTRANPQLVDLLKEMERGKSPYNLRRCFYGVLEQLNDDAVFKCYIELIRKTYIKNLVQRLANTCDSIKRERLIWFSSGMASEAVEIAASELDFVVFDHQKDMIFFQNTRIQDGVLSSELSEFAKELRVVCTKLNATNSSSSLFDLVRPHLDVERQDVFARLEVIEKRKRHQEELKKQQLEEQKARELQARLLREEEEKKRRAREAERREREKLEKEEREKNLQVATEMIENFKKNNDSFTAASRVKLDELVQNLDTYDPESIMKIQDEIVAEEERIRKRKEKDQEKKLNYLVRALRLEEHSLLLDAYARQQQEDKEYFEAQFKKIREEHKAAFDLAAQERKRLLKIVDDKESFRANVFEQRQQDLEDARVKQDERIAEFKKKKKVELERLAREREEKERIRLEEEERQKQLEIEKKKAAEEAERLQKQKAELVRKKKEERDKEIAEIAAKELEAERRRAEKKAQMLGSRPSASPRETGPWKRGGVSEVVREPSTAISSPSDTVGSWRKPASGTTGFAVEAPKSSSSDRLARIKPDSKFSSRVSGTAALDSGHDWRSRPDSSARPRTDSDVSSRFRPLAEPTVRRPMAAKPERSEESVLESNDPFGAAPMRMPEVMSAPPKSTSSRPEAKAVAAEKETRWRRPEEKSSIVRKPSAGRKDDSWIRDKQVDKDEEDDDGFTKVTRKR